MTFRWQGTDPLVGFTLMVTPNIEQRTFRFRNDDGSQTAATWKATQGTSITGITTAEKFRVRYEMQETAGGDTTSVTFSLEYDLNSSGTWTQVTTTSNVVRIVSSTGVSNGTATTNLLTAGTGTFLAGQVLTTANSAATSMTANNHTEYEWNLQLVDGTVSNNDVIALRCMTSAGTRTVGAAGNGTVTASVAAVVYNLSPASAVHTHTASTPSAVAVVPLTPSSASHTHTSGTPTLTEAGDPFGVPTGLAVTPTGNTTMDVSWNAVDTATGYDIERDSVVIATDHVGLLYQDTGLSTATEYSYRVRAVQTAS
jgi:hypothetical protein